MHTPVVNSTPNVNASGQQAHPLQLPAAPTKAERTLKRWAVFIMVRSVQEMRTMSMRSGPSHSRAVATIKLIPTRWTSCSDGEASPKGTDALPTSVARKARIPAKMPAVSAKLKARASTPNRTRPATPNTQANRTSSQSLPRHTNHSTTHSQPGCMSHLSCAEATETAHDGSAVADWACCANTWAQRGVGTECQRVPSSDTSICKEMHIKRPAIFLSTSTRKSG